MAGAAVGADVVESGSTTDRPQVEDKVVRYSFRAMPNPVPADQVARADLLEHRRRGQPLILGGLPERSLRRLQHAYPRALKKVREVEACAEMFEGMGADGIEVLSSTLYGPAVSAKERQVCEDRDALAVTTVGGSRTVLCDAFGQYARGTGVVILIHEALHAAGMTEKPADPDALSSVQINRLVRTNCGL